MLIKVRKGPYDPQNGDSEPKGEDLWSGGDQEFSGAVLNAINSELEFGTWYELEDFAKLFEGAKPPEEHEVMSTITIDQPGVDGRWSTAIGIGENSAALMICHSVISHARRLTGGSPVWVWVE